MKIWHSLLPILCLCMILAGCGPNEDQVNQTIAAEVAQKVILTVENLPTATALPTYQPQPSQTMQPTLTAVASYTSQPTYTPQFTLTPADTLTPRPTWTNTPTATATNTPVPVAVNPVASSGGLTVPNILAVKVRLRALADSMDWTSERDIFGNTINTNMTVLCDQLFAAHASFNAVLIVPPNSNDARLQNAYSLYQAGIDRFLGEIGGWLEGCVPGGSGTLTGPARSSMVIAREDALRLLDQAIAVLEGQ